MKNALIVLATFLSISIAAQKETKELKGDILFENYSFSAAIDKYSIPFSYHT